MMLAQLETVPSEFLKNAVLIVAGTAAVIYYVKEIFGGKKKREVTFGFEAASKAEFEEQKRHCTKRHSELFTAIEQMEDIMSASLDKKIEKLDSKLDVKHSENTVRLNGFGSAIGGLEKETNLQNQQLAAMNSDIKAILGRMPRR